MIRYMKDVHQDVSFFLDILQIIWATYPFILLSVLSSRLSYYIHKISQFPQQDFAAKISTNITNNSFIFDGMQFFFNARVNTKHTISRNYSYTYEYVRVRVCNFLNVHCIQQYPLRVFFIIKYFTMCFNTARDILITCKRTNIAQLLAKLGK